MREGVEPRSCVLPDAEHDGRQRSHATQISALAPVATFTPLLGGVVLHGAPVLSPRIVVAAAFIGLYGLGFASNNERVHAAIVIANVTVIAVAYAPLIYTPFAS